MNYPWKDIRDVHTVIGFLFLIVSSYFLILGEKPIQKNSLNSISFSLKSKPTYHSVRSAKSTNSWYELESSLFSNIIKIEGNFNCLNDDAVKSLKTGDTITIQIKKEDFKKIAKSSIRAEKIKLVTIQKGNNLLLGLNCVNYENLKSMLTLMLSMFSSGLIFIFWRNKQDFPKILFIKVKAPILLFFLFLIIYHIILTNYFNVPAYFMRVQLK
ncbi:hypothetical protein GCM10027035_17980 [Emticicia sediminis]